MGYMVADRVADSDSSATLIYWLVLAKIRRYGLRTVPHK